MSTKLEVGKFKARRPLQCLGGGVLPEHHRRGAGFSLTELLVALGIVAVLVSLLIGGLARAREMARTTACLSNLHQLALAANEYAAHYRSAMPSDYFTPSGNWYQELKAYDTKMAENAVCPDATVPSGGVGTADLAWGSINMSGPPYSPGYPWLENAVASYGLNKDATPGGGIGALASMGSATLGGNDQFIGSVYSASSVSGVGSSAVNGNVVSGGAVAMKGNSNVSGSIEQNVQGLEPPDVTEIFEQMVAADSPWAVTPSGSGTGSGRGGSAGGGGGCGNSGRAPGSFVPGNNAGSSGNVTLDFSIHPIQIVNGNFTPSGQIIIIGAGTLLVTGNVDISGQFPSGGGAVNINIVSLGNVDFQGQTAINGDIYAAGSVSFHGGYSVDGMIVTDGTFTDRGKGMVVQGNLPSFDPRAHQGALLPDQPLFADAIWADAAPQSLDPVPSNLNLGNSTLSNTDEMGIFCINRHVNNVNVVYTDGSAHTVPLAKLWQLHWSPNFTPRTVTVPSSW